MNFSKGFIRKGIFTANILGLVLLLIAFGCKNKKSSKEESPEYKNWQKMTLTASAFNTTQAQTNGKKERETAWGDHLKPGVKAVAVSRDLIQKGMDHNTRIKIEGLEGYYKVLDKMGGRWKNKIDIYMGENVQKAQNWGEKKVTVYAEGIKNGGE